MKPYDGAEKTLHVIRADQGGGKGTKGGFTRRSEGVRELSSVDVGFWRCQEGACVGVLEARKGGR